MIGLRHLTLRVPDAEALDGLRQSPREAEGIPIEIKNVHISPNGCEKVHGNGPAESIT
jgi:hypothetical protein